MPEDDGNQDKLSNYLLMDINRRIDVSIFASKIVRGFHYLKLLLPSISSREERNKRRNTVKTLKKVAVQSANLSEMLNPQI
jgi:hypothetical protein